MCFFLFIFTSHPPFVTFMLLLFPIPRVFIRFVASPVLRLYLSFFEILLRHWWKPGATSKIASVLTLGLKEGRLQQMSGRKTAGLDEGDGEMGRWLGPVLGRQTPCTTQTIPLRRPTCCRGRKMLSYPFQRHRQMKQLGWTAIWEQERCEPLGPKSTGFRLLVCGLFAFFLYFFLPYK